MRNLEFFSVVAVFVSVCLFYQGSLNARDRKIKEQEQEIKQLKEIAIYNQS